MFFLGFYNDIFEIAPECVLMMVSLVLVLQKLFALYWFHFMGVQKISAITAVLWSLKPGYR